MHPSIYLSIYLSIYIYVHIHIYICIHNLNFIELVYYNTFVILDFYTVLMAACSSKRDEKLVLECVEMLIEKKAAINAEDRFVEELKKYI